MGEYVGISIGNYDFVGQNNTFGDLLALFSPSELTIEDEFDENGKKYARGYFAKTVYQAKRYFALMDAEYTAEKKQEVFATLNGKIMIK